MSTKKDKIFSRENLLKIMSIDWMNMKSGRSAEDIFLSV